MFKRILLQSLGVWFVCGLLVVSGCATHAHQGGPKVHLSPEEADALAAETRAAWAASSVPVVHHAIPLAISTEACEPLKFVAVVHGLVLTPGNLQGTAASTVFIDRVYYGPQDLLGKEFKDLSTGKMVFRSSSTRRGLDPAVPPFKQAEDGIWCLYQPSGTFIAVDTPLGFRPRVRRIEKDYYPIQLAMAEALESVSVFEPAEQRRRLRELRRSAEPRIAEMAADLLVAVGEESGTR